MELKGKAKLLRVFVGESDKAGHTPVYERVVKEARARGLAGATVWRGLMGYGAGSHIRTAKVLDLSTDLPVVVEIVDAEERIEAFLPVLHGLFEEAACGGLVTIETVEIIRYAGTRAKGAWGE